MKFAPIQFLFRVGLLALASLLVLASGCAPKGTSELAAADRYFEAGDYERAEIEYKNAVQAAGRDSHAIGRLGIIYLEQGRVRQSVPYLLKAKELNPEDLAVRQKLGGVYLSAGKFDEALAEADYILTRKPSDPVAPITYIQASLATPEKVGLARQRIEQLPDGAATGAPALTALGILELRDQKIEAAETVFQRALAADPKFAAAHIGLASVYRARKDKTKFEEALKAAADLSPIRSGNALQYAQYKLQSGDKEGGRKLLESISNEAPDYLPPLSLLAEIAATEKRYDDSAALTARILSRDPTHPEASLLSGRLKLVRGETEKAAEELEKLLTLYPKSAQTLYFLGLAYASAGDRIKAVDRLNQSIAASPMPEAILALATVNLRAGDFGSAVAALKPLIEKHPDNLQARMLLAEAYRAQGDDDDALAVYRATDQAFAKMPQVAYQSGLILLRQKKPSDARQAFNEALRRAPEFLQAREQLISMELSERKFEAALAHVDAELARDQKSAIAYVWKGRIHTLQGDVPLAIAAFNKALELRPDVPTAHFQLAQLYIQSKQQDQALASLQSVLKINPKDENALVMMGMIQDQQQNHAGAREAYEKVVSINPKSSLALNNLAVLYSERFNEVEKAYETAQKARELLPDQPHVSDTFGWVLYRMGQYARALAVLEESAAALPNVAAIQYHLGMTRYMMILEEPARQALERALELDGQMAESADIRRRLEILAIDIPTAGPEAIAVLEKSLRASPNDPLALTRLAALHERMGATDKAITAYEAAIKANSASAIPWLGLARLHAARNDTVKALDAAKAARKLAPEDATVARSLGTIAYAAGDSPWAASLLLEAVRKLPEDPELSFETARVVYSVGQVEEARELATSALATPPASNALFKPRESRPFAQEAEARRFLQLIGVAGTPNAGAAAEVEAALRSDPDSLPALIARGGLEELRGDHAAARLTYEKALARHTNFTPAKLRLALLSARLPNFDEKAFERAQQARTAYPNDPDAAKALGILTYRQGRDMTRAIGLLRESVRAREDAESLYFLGLAQLQNKDTADGRQSLEKAIAQGLPPEWMNDAKSKLAAAK